DFLERIPTTGPNELLRRDDDLKVRISSASRVCGCRTHHREPKAECCNAHHPRRWKQQAASRDPAEIHAHQRQHHPNKPSDLRHVVLAKRRTDVARGPLSPMLSENRTSWPTFRSSNCPPVTLLRWK